MANFAAIFAKVDFLEGGYSTDPNDRGGETFRGISRVANPDWDGWAVIDTYKETSGFPKTALESQRLIGMVKSLYKSKYWDVFGLDHLKAELLAYEVYEQAVNLGVTKTTYHVQTVLNALNYQENFGEDLSIDSKLGALTRDRLLKIANSSPQMAMALANGLNAMQGMHYLNLANAKSEASDYRKYIKGWLSKRAAAYVAVG